MLSIDGTVLYETAIGASWQFLLNVNKKMGWRTWFESNYIDSWSHLCIYICPNKISIPINTNEYWRMYRFFVPKKTGLSKKTFGLIYAIQVHPYLDVRSLFIRNFAITAFFNTFSIVIWPKKMLYVLLASFYIFTHPESRVGAWPNL